MTNYDPDSDDVLILDQATVRFGNQRINFDYSVKDAFRLGEVIIVWLDPDSYTLKFGQFPNLIALSESGVELWKAEFPTNQSGDRYEFIFSKKPLIASSFSSYRCEFDLKTGKIVEKEFLK